MPLWLLIALSVYALVLVWVLALCVAAARGDAPVQDEDEDEPVADPPMLRRPITIVDTARLGRRLEGVAAMLDAPRAVVRLLDPSSTRVAAAGAELLAPGPSLSVTVEPFGDPVATLTVVRPTGAAPFDETDRELARAAAVSLAHSLDTPRTPACDLRPARRFARN